MQTIQFKLINGVPVTTQSFDIAPVNFPILYNGSIVNGNVFSSSTAPATYDLVPNVYHIQLNSEATNDWYIQTTGSTVTASAAIVSGSYSTGSYCQTDFENLISTKAFGAFTSVDIQPLQKRNVGFNESFILADMVTYTTDASGSLIVPLVPQAYSVKWKDGYRNKSYNILVPNSASVDAALCIVTSNNVAKVISPQNTALYSYTADVIDEKIGAITFSGSLSSSFASASISSSYAQVAGTTLSTVSASFARTASAATSITFVPLTATSASFASQSISASWSGKTISSSYSVNADNATSAAFATSASLSQTASYVKNAQSASFVLNAVSASWAPIQNSTAFATSSSFASQSISASFASVSTSSSFATTAGAINFVPLTATSASFASQSISASLAQVAVSSSYAKNSDTASVANSISFVPVSATSSSLAQTASFVKNAQSASYFTGSVSSASYAKNSDTASLANAISFTPSSASYSVTSSFAQTANSINFVPSVAVSASFASASISSSNAFWANSSRVDDINNGLVVYLPFSEGTGSTIRNLSPWGVDATKKQVNNTGLPVVTGSGWNTNSKRGGFSQLLELPGPASASYIEFNNATIADGLPQLTFGIWYQSSGSTTSNGRIVTKFNGGTTGEFSYQLFDTNAIGVILVNSLAQRLDQTVTGTPKLNDNKWHYIAATYDGAFSSVYVDGKLCGATAFTGSLNTTTSPLRIGTFENIGFQPTTGYIDEFKLWQRALTPNEILYLYNDGNLENSIYTDAGGNNTISGSTTFANTVTASLLGTASYSNQSLSASFAQSASAANSITFTPATASFAITSSNSVTASFAVSASKAQSSSFATSASFASVATSASFGSVSVSSSFATTSSFSQKNLSSSFATTTINLANRFVSALDAGNGINVIDADGSSMGITGGGITIIYNPLSAVSAFELRDVNNATLSKIDGKGNFVCVNSASVSGSLFGTASYAQTASFITASKVVGTIQSASLAKNANGLISGSGNILWDNLNTKWTVNSAMELQGGIYDGANAVVAAQFDDQHVLNDSGENNMYDFSTFNNGTFYGNHTFINGGLTGSVFGTASVAQSASYLNGNGNRPTFNDLTASNGVIQLGQSGKSGQITFWDVANDDAITLTADDNSLKWPAGTLVLGDPSGNQGAIELYDAPSDEFHFISATDGGLTVSSNTLFDVGGQLEVDGTSNFIGVVSFVNASGSQVHATASYATDGKHALTSSYVSASASVIIQSGNNITEFRNTSSAQTVNIYGAFSNTSSFNRLAIYQGSNGMVIESQPQGAASSSGDLTISHAANHSIKFNTSGSLRWTIGATGDWLPGSGTQNIGQAGQGVNIIYANTLLGTASYAPTSSIARALWENNNSNIQYDAGSNVFECNVGFDVSAAGIYDGANGVTAIQVNDSGHILYDINGLPALDFTNPKQLLGTWSGSISNAVTASLISPVTWSAISAASNVTWSAATNVYEDRKTLTVTGPTTMSIQGLYNGWSGVLKVKNGNTGSLLFVTPKPKVINAGSGSLVLSNISASIDVISLDYDGTDLMASVGNTFN